ncbi:MAG: 3-dehydroquinate synthase [Ignavibacteriaceae bacterium]|nr:3-dehydroquinate synthase [Ignavibacteriaceae bacterium]
MIPITIDSEIGKSKILAGESISNVTQYLPDNKKIVIITDEKINAVYGHLFPKADLIIFIPQGEKNKSLQSAELIIQKMAEAEFDRSSFILAIGGGIVCDIAGFAAAIYMRGIKFGFVSTTLLSQVDASVGGKNGVNFGGYKNLVGTFCLPEFVICDPEMLKTLPQSELISGIAEVVKHGLIADANLFEFIEQNTDKIRKYDLNVLMRFVHDSVIIKSKSISRLCSMI